MSHPVDRLPWPTGPAQLLFTPCPGTQQTSVAAAVDTLKQAGAAAVISLTPSAEMARLQAESLPAACAQAGLLWCHWPIGDEQGPGEAFAQAWARDRDAVLALLQQGQSVAIHCRGGSGRTGLIAARLLMTQGISSDAATAQVQALRPKALRHPAQLAWLQNTHD